ncbi:MAG: hypothetical protein K2G44_00285 [Clostridia bacterium]|nr:hypothetical protein [Clostridia bacterium]
MILTPVTLWKDFNDKLPLNEEIVWEEEKDGAVFRGVYFYGRQTEKDRVKIYAEYVFPTDVKEFPAVMFLFETGFAFDRALVMRFVKNGYAVLCVDYCGESAHTHYTKYPKDVDYANFIRAGAHLTEAEPSAKETSWYEWAGVARYAARYLKEKQEVTAVGAVGLRTGGEILFKIAPYAPISCMTSVCAAGWLAYRGLDKFSNEQKNVFNEERHRFIAGLDSQSYAPYVKCPVLLISAINDPKHDYDRVYDTFLQINPEVEKAILYSAHGNGLVGSHSLVNINLFLDKYLKGRSVFISKPIEIDFEEDEEGNLLVRGSYDSSGEIESFGIYFTEKATDSDSRDWTRILGQSPNEDNVGIIPLSLFTGTQKALVYTFVNYSNNFSVTSEIMEITQEKPYPNSKPVSRVLYTSADGLNGFAAYRPHTRSLADCFVDGEASRAKILPGYGGIQGITSESGIISYRVGEPRFAPPEGASLSFDAYAANNAKLKVTFFLDAEGEESYSVEVDVEGGGKWKQILLSPDDFKSETGMHLADFQSVVSVLFSFDGEVLINNVLWI